MRPMLACGCMNPVNIAAHFAAQGLVALFGLVVGLVCLCRLFTGALALGVRLMGRQRDQGEEGEMHGIDGFGGLRSDAAMCISLWWPAATRLPYPADPCACATTFTEGRARQALATGHGSKIVNERASSSMSSAARRMRAVSSEAVQITTSAAYSSTRHA